MTSKAKIFISYTTRDIRDSNLANLVRETLLSQGFEVWMAPYSIPYGKEWKKEVIAGVLEETTHYLVILSEASIHSSWVLREISLAKQRKLSDDSFIILAIQIGNIGNYRNKFFIESFQKIPFADDKNEQTEIILKGFGLKVSNNRNASMSKQALYKIMIKKYDLEDFKELCFRLGVKYDDLRGESLKSRIIYLIDFHDRNGNIQKLIHEVDKGPLT